MPTPNSSSASPNAPPSLPPPIANCAARSSARERIERQLKHETLHDALTGLPNRALLLDRLGAALARYVRDPRRLFAVLFLDLDRFKIINDSVGHLLGDELLEEVGRRIADCLEPRDVVARLGGDEFAVLLTDIENDEDATASAQRLIDVLNAPIRLANKEVFTSASIGIAVAAPALSQGRGTAARCRCRDVSRQGRRPSSLRAVRRDAASRRAVSARARKRSAPRGRRGRNSSRSSSRSSASTTRRSSATKRCCAGAIRNAAFCCPESFLTVAEESGISEQIDWLMFERVCAVAHAR